MLDVALLRTKPKEVAAACAKRGVEFDVAEYTALEQQRKKLQVRVQQLQERRSAGAAEIGKRAAQGEEVAEIKQEMQQVQQELKPAKQQLEQLLQQLQEIQLRLPNIIDPDVPVGKDETANRLELTWGEKPEFKFKPKEHFELFPAEISFELASKLSGSRFVLLRSKIAQLHRALIMLMLDVHTSQHGYEEINIPVILNRDTLTNSGQLPKFEEDLFLLSNGTYLSPTAEVALVNLARDRIFAADELPLKVTCHSLCFRSEAGSYGKDVKGILRQHQFEKVELVQITKPADSAKALEEMCQQAQKILQLLEIPYRVMTLCSGDIGFAAAKTYDLEVWLPGQNCYREISSCSNCRDFQARRLQARWRPDPQKKDKELVHALNASGLAVGRTLIAVLENYQDAAGMVTIPAALKPYLPQNYPAKI